MKVNFTRSRQETGSYCGPAVAQMLLSGLGYASSQRQIVEACGAQKTVMRVGISLVSLAKGIKKFYPDVVVWSKSSSSIDDIVSLMENGYLVAFDWQGVFASDEYFDDEEDKWGNFLAKIKKEPQLKGDQGHYCIALEVNKRQGYLRFADPYGHYAGKDRFVGLWEFEERWWDDRIDVDEKGKKIYVLEDRLIFILAKKGDKKPAELGMTKL